MLSGSLPLGSSERQVEFESGEYQDNVASRPNQKKQKQKVKSRYEIRSDEKKRNRNLVKSMIRKNNLKSGSGKPIYLIYSTVDTSDI